MNPFLRAICFFALTVFLCTGCLSTLAQAETDGVVTNVVFDGVNYENRTEFAWEWHKPIPDGGIKWDGTEEFLYITYPEDDDIDYTPDGVPYIKNQLIFLAEMDENIGDEFAAIESLMADYGMRIIGYLAPSASYQVESINNLSYPMLEQLIEALQREPLIVSDTIFISVLYSISENDSLSLANIPNNGDIIYNDLFWNGDELNESKPAGTNWAVEFIQALSAWKYDPIMRQVRVGVIDEGFSLHSDIEYNYIVNNVGTYSSRLHGTHVAGTIAATHDDKGMSGIFHNAYLMASSVFSNANKILLEQSSFHFLEAYILHDLVVKSREDIQPCVINYSMAFDFSEEWFPQLTSLVKKVIYSNFHKELSRLIEAGFDFVICSAAGNFFEKGIDAKSSNAFNLIEELSLRERIIVVGSHSLSNNDTPMHTNYSQVGERVDILAPGDCIYSTISCLNSQISNWFGVTSGTSMASPHVAGVAAMVWAIDPNFSGDKVKSIILESCRETLDPRTEDNFRSANHPYPLLNALSAVELARQEARKATISGTVMDTSTHLALPNTTIQITEEGTIISETATNNDGTFTLSVKPGIYEVRCIQVGYASQTTNVTVKSAETQTLNIALSKLNAGGGVLTGHVQTINGSPIPEVKIQVENSSIIALTDDNGSFTLSVPSERLTLQFSKDGFTSTKCSVIAFNDTVVDIGTITLAYENTIRLGGYLTLGAYLDEPIVWRCVAIDENGPLMLSDKILCLKAFDVSGTSAAYHTDGWGNVRAKYGSNCWSDSNLRQWLNASDETVAYSHCAPNASRILNGYNAYDTEAGFLSAFTDEELSKIKTVTQKVYINEWDTNREGYCDGGTAELRYGPTSSIVDYSRYYHQNVTDRIFLLNPSQADAVSRNFGEYLGQAYPTEAAVANSNYASASLNTATTYPYWLGIPSNLGASYEHVIVIGQSGLAYPRAYEGIYGVRPAFYLDGYTVEP